MAIPDGNAAPAPRYDALSIGLHWLTAGLIVALYASAQLWDLAGRRTPLNASLKSVHISLGILLVAVLVARLCWRAVRAAPPAVPMVAWMRQASRWAHRALYALLAGLVGLGLAIAWAGTAPVGFFGLFTLPAPFVLDRGTARAMKELHELAANAIMAMAALHALAALWHHYALRDGTLRQMLPVFLLPGRTRPPLSASPHARSGTNA